MVEKTAILIVNWNLREDTLACIRALFAAGVRDEHVVLVDNGSSDRSPEAVQTEFEDRVVQIQSDRNLGLAGGINAGLPAALRTGADWIFLLNNDTVVSEDVFERLGAALQDLPGVGIWGPRIVYDTAPERVWSLGDRRVLGTLLTRPISESAMSSNGLPSSIPVDVVSGCAMLVHRQVFERIGGFDNSFFLFAEEVDFCLRAGQAGIDLAVAPRAVVRHKVSLSTDRDRPLARFLRIRNQIRVYRRYASGAGKPFYFVFTALRTVKMASVDLVRGDSGLAAPSFRGWAAGWFTRADRHNP